MLLHIVNGCSSLSKAISLKRDGEVKIDNTVDSGHKLVSIFLGICFVIVTASRYAVDPIRCSRGIISSDSAWPISMIENYCYMGKTYVMVFGQAKVSKTEKNIRNDADLSFMGRWMKKSQKRKIRIYQTRYYWMQYIILLQSFSFIIPKFFWKKFERGKLRHFTSLLSSYKQIKIKKRVNKDNEEEENAKEKEEKEENCFQFIALERFWKLNFGQQNLYFFLYLISEMLYLINVAAQYYFVDFFLNHMLYKDSWALLKETFDLGDPHLDYFFRFTFPIVTMCELPIFDLNSNAARSTLTCVLTLNYLYRKIVFISWILFSILGILTCSNIFFYIFIALCPKVFKSKILCFYYNIQSRDDMQRFFNQNIQIGDWFFLFMLKPNLDPVKEVQFREFVLNEVIEKCS